MGVIGGGPVGCEYASVFTALGVEVTLLDQADRLLPFMDTEISGVLVRAFAGMGMRLVLGSGVARCRDPRLAAAAVTRGGRPRHGTDVPAH